MTKLIAIYLPQYHEIEENNKWWGKGHTEWTSCKKAKRLFKDHYQPRIPLNNNYYDLTDREAQLEQVKLAKQNGIYGFCYYHYWFEGKMLLEKPMENMLHDKEIDMPFCISWANHTWTNSINKRGRKVLIEQTYGDKEDWENHFNYLKKFFKDKRYIRVNDKPVMVIYNAKDIECWEEMKSTWDEMAVNEGFKGIHYVNTLKDEQDIDYSNKYRFDAQFEYQPTFALRKRNKLEYNLWYYLKRILYKDFIDKPCICNYDRVWRNVIDNTPSNDIVTYLGSYSDWDTTARWGNKGIVHKGANPQKFKKYLKQQITRSKTMNESEFIFITAWNEWSEGAYLEPDEKYKYKYLEVIKEAIYECDNNINNIDRR